MSLDRASSLALVTDEAFALHEPTGWHPERPARLVSAERGVRNAASALLPVAAREATEAELSRAHDPAYLERLRATLGARTSGFLDGDTYFNRGTQTAAWRAAGGACALVEHLLATSQRDAAVGEAVSAPARVGALLARPPGHHATRTRAMGFCLLNNVAVAAAHALACGLERVAVVDWDVHHGNGTQDIFEADPRVLFVSLHQWPLYPGTGASNEVGQRDGRGRTVNVPLPSDSHGGDYVAAFERVVLPLVEAHRPELVLVSAGFDAHANDPLSSMRLTADDYAWMARSLRSIAERTAQGRVFVALEGGYDLPAIESSIGATVRALLTDEPICRSAEPVRESTTVALRAVIDAQRPFWSGVL